MTQGFYTIESNTPLTDSVYLMRLLGDTSSLTAPGQFVNIKLEGRFLRRPISVCDYDERSITIIYKVVGDGTKQMSRMQAGQVLDVLCGLGNGFDTQKSGARPVLIGGGVGVPPMYNLCKRLIAEGKAVSVILGFNTASEVFYQKEFEDLGATVYVTTVDGSLGTKGYVTDVLKAIDSDYFYTHFACPLAPRRSILPRQKFLTEAIGSFMNRSIA